MATRKKTVDTVSNLFKRGLFVPSKDFTVRKLADGRHKVNLRYPFPTAVCPLVDELTVTFSGLNLCGCATTPNGLASYNVVAAPDLNGTFVVPRLVDPTYNIWALQDGAGTWTVDQFNLPSCDDSMGHVRVTQPGTIAITCTNTAQFPYSSPGFHIQFYISGGYIMLFFGDTASPGALSGSNTLVCGGPSHVEGGVVGAYGGTVSISWRLAIG